MFHSLSGKSLLATVLLGSAVVLSANAQVQSTSTRQVVRPTAAPAKAAKAKNVIFFVGDGMGVSTVTATRVFSVGLDGKLMIDQLPFTALSKTYTTDHITPDSAGTMTAMFSGQNTNSGIIGMDASTERKDFNGDGDGAPTTNLIELAKAAGKRVGVVSTARVTHATPAAAYAHINDRDLENEIALQSLPTDATYNAALGSGVDVMFGCGRRFFVPNTIVDEEGSKGSRPDGRDLRQEFQAAGYSYTWNKSGFNGLTEASLPVLGLFESSHMQFEYDRVLDIGGEPSLTEMTTKAIDLLSGDQDGYVLMVESGRIDHAHHAGNAFRSLVDTEEFDSAIAAAIASVDLSETLIVVTADHSHVFNIAGYPLRPKAELPYSIPSFPAGYVTNGFGSGIFNTVYDISSSTGAVFEAGDANGVPYTALVYGNGPGYRSSRVSPFMDMHPGLNGSIPSGPTDPEYLQEAAVPMGSETHSGEEVGLYAIGAGSRQLRGTVKNTMSFELMKAALGL